MSCDSVSLRSNILNTFYTSDLFLRNDIFSLKGLCSFDKYPVFYKLEGIRNNYYFCLLFHSFLLIIWAYWKYANFNLSTSHKNQNLNKLFSSKVHSSKQKIHQKTKVNFSDGIQKIHLWWSRLWIHCIIRMLVFVFLIYIYHDHQLYTPLPLPNIGGRITTKTTWFWKTFATDTVMFTNHAPVKIIYCNKNLWKTAGSIGLTCRVTALSTFVCCYQNFRRERG